MRWALIAVVLLLAACSSPTDVSGSGGEETAAPAATSVPVAEVPTQLRNSLPPCPELPAAQAVSNGLPNLSLPCLGPGEPVSLGSVRGPAVINLWASWCPPCRAELPGLASFAQQTQGEVLVLGIDVADDPVAAATLWQELGVTFPTVADPQSATRPGLRWSGLPVTYFVDEQGVIVHRHDGPIPDLAGWQEAAADYLRVSP